MFCYNCREDVDYFTLNGYRYKNGKKYKLEYAYCLKCKSELLVPEIRDRNIEVLSEVV